MHRSILALVIAGSLSAQTTLVVSRNGPYKTLQGAIDAAKPGDLIEVRGGTYAGATCTKGVQIYGTTRFDVSSKFSVKDLKADQHFGLSNLRLRSFSGGGVPLVIENCRGSVRLDAVEGYGSAAGKALTVSACDHVAVTNSQFNTHWESAWNRVHNFGGAVRIGSSNVSMQHTQLLGRHIRYWNGRSYSTSTAPGAEVFASRLMLVDCHATGGSGYCITSPFGCIPIRGNAGVEATIRTDLIVKRTTANGGSNPVGGTAPDLRADATSRIVKDPGVTTKVEGPTTTRDLYDLAAKTAAPGNPVEITIRGKGPVSFAVFANHPAKPVTGPPVDIWLDLRNPVLLYADALTTSRTRRVTTPKHLPLGLTVCLQAVVLTKRGLESSSPALISLR